MTVRCLVKLSRCSIICSQSRQIHASPQRKNTLIFTEQHDELKKTVKKIIEKDINPYVNEWEKERCFPIKDVYRKFANAGLLGITRETEYGGLGLDYSYKVAFIEALRDIDCMSIPFSLIAFDIAIEALTNFGNQEQKKEFLVPSLTGNRIPCVGISEVQSASDVSSIATRAIRKGDELILNGGKMWISNGPQADWIIVLANTSEGQIHRNKSLICVPLDTPGISCSKVQLMATHSCSTGQFFFDNVKVPAKYILGEEGMGFKYTMITFQDERLATSVYAHAIQERIIEMTAEYCKQREVDGKSLIDNQVIHFTLAELQTEVELLRSLVYRTAAQKIKGEDYTILASMAKFKCGRLTREVTDKCLQYWGAMGVSEDSLISRFYRDCRPLSIAAGADEVMLRIISKFMGNY